MLDQETLRRDFDALAADLRSYIAGRQVILMPNPGNFGDGLILAGTVRFFEDYGIPFRINHVGKQRGKRQLLGVLLRDLLTRNHVFIYGGGGAWAKSCDLGFRNVAMLERFTRKIFVLPTTFELFGLRTPVRLYRRDNDESLANVPNSKFCHDMALYLALIPSDEVLPNRTAPTKKFGFILRTDNEARSDRVMPEGVENKDISKSGHCEDPIDEFLLYIDQFEHIITDRLHVAIGGVLLGKRVSVVQGSYFKIRAIFRASLQNRFSDVELIDDSRLAELMEEAGAEFVSRSEVSLPPKRGISMDNVQATN